MCGTLCTALLKIAEGKSPHWVALHGLRQGQDPDAVYNWLNIYEAEGLEGILAHQHGGDRKGCL